MPIDPSIALGVKPVQVQTWQERQMMEDQMAQNQLARQLGEMKMQAAKTGLERQNKLSSILSQQYETPDARENALMQGGFLEEATNLGKERRANIKSDVEIEASKFKLANDRATAFLNLASSAKDQRSYELALQTARSMGLDTSTAPAQYDPAFVASFGQQALTAKERLEAEARRRGLDIQAMSQSESARHNRATEGLQLRGQNLVDARSREANAVKQQEAKPLTDAQAKAALFGSRMKASQDVLESLASEGVDTSIPGSRAGFGIGALVNVMSPARQQQLDQAKRDFVNAVLRRESGAVISEQEFGNAEKQYFPQIGDTPEVKAQKTRNREIAIRGMLAEIPEARKGVVGEIIGPGAVTSGADLGGGFRVK